VVLLVLGFVLTTVVGGFLGYYFQRRAWDANRRESERQAAAAVFDETSRAMDQRLYRMWLLYWAMKAGDEHRLARAMEDYRSVLQSWNDNLNRKLALISRYFGERVWEYVDGEVYVEFARLGRHLEEHYRRRNERAAEPDPRLLAVGRGLRALNDDVYYLNRFLIAMIQRGGVGLYQPAGDERGRPPWKRHLGPGSRSMLVARWQRNLNLVGNSDLEVDGWFGHATLETTLGFQRAHGLSADGIVGEATRGKMDEVLDLSRPATEGRRAELAHGPRGSRLA
jgi:hypothetical protein